MPIEPHRDIFRFDSCSKYVPSVVCCQGVFAERATVWPELQPNAQFLTCNRISTILRPWEPRKVSSCRCLIIEEVSHGVRKTLSLVNAVLLLHLLGRDILVSS